MARRRLVDYSMEDMAEICLYRKYAEIDDKQKTRYFHLHSRDFMHRDKTRDFWEKRKSAQNRRKNYCARKIVQVVVEIDEKPGLHDAGFVMHVADFVF